MKIGCSARLVIGTLRGEATISSAVWILYHCQNAMRTLLKRKKNACQGIQTLIQRILKLWRTFINLWVKVIHFISIVTSPPSVPKLYFAMSIFLGPYFPILIVALSFFFKEVDFNFHAIFRGVITQIQILTMTKHDISENSRLFFFYKHHVSEKS